MPKSNYKVLTPIDHDNKRYAIDKPIELTDEEAAPLLAVGAIAAMAAPEIIADAAPSVADATPSTKKK